MRMLWTAWAVSAAAWSAGHAQPQAAGGERLRNERVAVTEVALKPGESEHVQGKLPGLLVFQTAGPYEMKGARAAARRGEARALDAGPREIRNTGASELRYFRLEFPGAGADERWGPAGLSPHYRVLLENRYARVYDIRIAASTSEPRHSHHDRVVICLSGATMKHTLPGGGEESSTLATGEVVWRRGSTHVGHNLGTTDLWVIAVEPK